MMLSSISWPMGIPEVNFVEKGEHHHAPHRGPGIDAHGYGARLEVHSAKAVPPDAVEGLLRRMVAEIARRCLEGGARAIGHIKCYLKTEQGFAKADIVRMRDGAYSESRLDSPVTDGSLVINSILLGLPEDELERITMQTIRSLLSEKGFSLVSDQEGQREHG